MDRVVLGVSLVAHATGVVARVLSAGGLRVQGLVRRFRVQDQRGHIRRPRIRYVVLKPANIIFT